MDVDPQKKFFANLSLPLAPAGGDLRFRQSVATRDLKKNDTEISQSLSFFDMTSTMIIATNNQETKKTGSLCCEPVFNYISFNYSARSVKRWKPVAVSSLSKPFKKSATEIFSFWQ